MQKQHLAELGESMHRRQRTLTKSYSKTKAFALNLFAKVVSGITSLLFLSLAIRSNSVQSG